MRTWILAALLIAPMAGVAQQPAKPKPIWARNHPLPHGFNVGEAFPTIALPSAVDGKTMSIADFRGRKVIVNIFASW
ncbi:MAG TPA: hypothetical protein VFA59_11740 [Vicinamibacterales bacterium]|nr:hypothetical protein [Vicinamibacterales bacterium]